MSDQYSRERSDASWIAWNKALKEGRPMRAAGQAFLRYWSVTSELWMVPRDFPKDPTRNIRRIHGVGMALFSPLLLPTFVIVSAFSAPLSKS